MKKYLLFFCFSILFTSQSVFGLELRKDHSASQADANYCGDLNRIVTYSAQFSEDEIDKYDGKFNMTKKSFQKIANAIQEEFELDNRMIVTARYERALSHLISDLALKTDERDGQPYLASCWDFDALDDFGLRYSKSKNKLHQKREAKKHSYYVISELSDWDATDFEFNVVVDTYSKSVVVYLIW